MLLVDNIFVFFAGKVFKQIIGIPMGTNCAPLLADKFLYSYKAEFRQSLLSAGKKRFASRFNFTYRYIDDVLSINNLDFENYLGQMYPPELEIKDTTESNTSASYLDLLLSIGIVLIDNLFTAWARTGNSFHAIPRYEYIFIFKSPACSLQQCHLRSVCDCIA